MAEATDTAPQEPTQAQEGSGEGVSPLDPDFLLFALPLAFFLDILSYVVMGLDLGIIAAVVNILLGGLLILWMVLRGKRIDQAKQTYQKAIQTARRGRAGLSQRRAATQQVARAAGKRTSKRLLKRALIMYIGNSVPILNFIPFWMIGVVLMLREK